ncbi:hypothetical protein D915_010487 [Fasciola hepatica]|uniref:Uncharacterized protein n=1 Tax=Fasciola hepatica TaxID=6192 RepID=A0A4E0RPT2_FASHE|nr:hypothetical protein D915_010487 [Fasciola hepatica]
MGLLTDNPCFRTCDCERLTSTTEKPDVELSSNTCTTAQTRCGCTSTWPPATLVETESPTGKGKTIPPCQAIKTTPCQNVPPPACKTTDNITIANNNIVTDTTTSTPPPCRFITTVNPLCESNPVTSTQLIPVTTSKLKS